MLPSLRHRTCAIDETDEMKLYISYINVYEQMVNVSSACAHAGRMLF